MTENAIEVGLALVRGLTLTYLFLAGVIVSVCLPLWILTKPATLSPPLKRAVAAVIFALGFAPSIFGYDLGAVTVPAIFVLALGILGMVRAVAVLWSLLSLLVIALLAFGVLSLSSFLRFRLK